MAELHQVKQTQACVERSTQVPCLQDLSGMSPNAVASELAGGAGRGN
jgi:hypothetical protein